MDENRFFSPETGRTEDDREEEEDWPTSKRAQYNRIWILMLLKERAQVRVAKIKQNEPVKNKWKIA